MPNSSSNTVIVVSLRARVVVMAASTTLCDAWEVLEEKSIVNCAGVVLFRWTRDNRREEKSNKGQDSAAGWSNMYTFAVCVGPVAMADLGPMTATKE